MITKISSRQILITEDNSSKRNPLLGELNDNTTGSIRKAIERNEIENIPPIIVLCPPLINKIKEGYELFKSQFKRLGNRKYSSEEEIFNKLLEENPNLLLCYNGNRRLEQHQIADIEINAILISNQEEYDKIPENELRVPHELKNEKPSQYFVDRHYVLAYFSLLDDVVLLKSSKYETEKGFDKLKDAQKERLERRRKNALGQN